jgi:hypothetical protein
MTYPDTSDGQTIHGQPWYVGTDSATDTVVEQCRATYARALDYWGTRLVIQHGALRYSDIRVWDREPTAEETAERDAGRVVVGSIVAHWPSGAAPRDELYGP